MSLGIKTAFVLAAGRGERLRPLTDKTPKPLALIKGKPILDYCLQNLSEARKDLGLERVVLNAWHLKEQIISYAASRANKFGFEIRVSQEPELLGTGGGLRRAYPYMVEGIGEGPFLMLNGDCLWKGRLVEFCRSAIKQKDAESIWWLAPEKTDQTLITVEGRRIAKIGNLWRDERTMSSLQKQERGCFSGIQLVHSIDVLALPQKGCIIRDYWLKRLQSGATLNADFEGLESWIDIGTMDRYNQVAEAKEGSL